MHGSWSDAQRAELAEVFGSLAATPCPVERIFPGAVIYTRAEVEALRALQVAIHAGITAIVEARLDVPALRACLSMEPPVEDILRALHGRPYATGTLRPDVLCDADGVFRVCEINARFSANGYPMSDVMDRAAEVARRWVPAGPVRRPWPAGSWFVADETFIVRGREPGLDVHMIPGLHTGRRRCRMVSPDALELRGGRLSIDGVALDRPEVRLCLELHQDELLDLGAERLLALHAHTRYFNDLRTVFIAHDKRTLSVLCDPDAMRPLVGAERAALLARHIVPTYPLATRPDVRAQALGDRGPWVLKANKLGKGVGMVFGAECSAEAWRDALSDPERASHLLQPVVESRTFDLVRSDGRSEAVRVVGMLMGLDHHALGPGMPRASAGKVVSISRGWMLIPMEAGSEND